jgi:hypothetical protein
MQWFIDLIQQVTKWREDAKRARADYEWRIGYLHAMDRRLFPEVKPMLPPLEYARYKADSKAFASGEYYGKKAPMIGTGLSHAAEHHRRTCQELAVEGFSP